jgi:hypothetical protein
LTPLHEAIDNVKSAKVMLDLESSITDLKVNIQKVLNIQTTNMDSLNQQKLRCQKETFSMASCNGVKVSLQFLWTELIHFTQQGVSWREQRYSKRWLCSSQCNAIC